MGNEESAPSPNWVWKNGDWVVDDGGDSKPAEKASAPEKKDAKQAKSEEIPRKKVKSLEEREAEVRRRGKDPEPISEEPSDAERDESESQKRIAKRRKKRRLPSEDGSEEMRENKHEDYSADELGTQPLVQRPDHTLHPHQPKEYDQTDYDTLMKIEYFGDENGPYQEELPEFLPPYDPAQEKIPKTGMVKNRCLIFLGVLAIIYHFGFICYTIYLAIDIYGKLGNSGCPTLINTLTDSAIDSGDYISFFPNFFKDIAKEIAKVVYGSAFYWAVWAFFNILAYLFLVIICGQIYLYDVYFLIAKTYSFNMGAGTKCLTSFLKFTWIFAANIMIIFNCGCISWMYLFKSLTTGSVECLTLDVGNYSGLVLTVLSYSNYATFWIIVYFFIYMSMWVAYRKGNFDEKITHEQCLKMVRDFGDLVGSEGSYEKMRIAGEDGKP
jgi:hypothetical protein